MPPRAPHIQGPELCPGTEQPQGTATEQHHTGSLLALHTTHVQRKTVLEAGREMSQVCLCTSPATLGVLCLWGSSATRGTAAGKLLHPIPSQHWVMASPSPQAPSSLHAASMSLLSHVAQTVCMPRIPPGCVCAFLAMSQLGKASLVA